jgi:rhodanese-related sulfurtransferase
MSREEFVIEVTHGLLPPPQYFAKNAAMNKGGYESIDVVMERGVIPLSVERFAEVVNEAGAMILDTRLCKDFREGFIPNSVFIGLDGQFASWVGTLIPDLDQPIVLVSDPGTEEETVMRLARVGYDNALGYLDGGFDAWSKAGKEIDVVLSTTAAEVADLVKSDDDKKPVILDVRKPTEYESEHVVGAVNIPLNYINDYMDRLDRDHEYHISCVSGYRSMIMASILKARGFEKLIDVSDGWEGFEQTDIPKTEFFWCKHFKNLFPWLLHAVGS